tara:strand:+ start:4441 stop:4611 length:171 start_codon:yes stop_codon:yes gene_type:complete
VHDIVERCQSIRFGGFDDEIKYGTGMCAVGCLAEQPSFFADDKGFNRAFSAVIVNA